MCRNNIMPTTPRNLAYEVNAEEAKRTLKQPPVSQPFLDDCRRTAQKYRKKDSKARMKP